MTQPFEGARVIDFSQVFAGPFASYQLALLGVDVSKIERPGGEMFPFSAIATDLVLDGAWPHLGCHQR